MDKGYVCFSPITHSHPLDMAKQRDPEFWYNQDLYLLEVFDAILMCPGWKQSIGCNREFQKARDFHIDIIFYEDRKTKIISEDEERCEK